MFYPKITLNKTNTRILICCHKKCDIPLDPDGIFFPIHVGAALSNTDLGIQRDDQVNGHTCDNISIKNKSFCELTGMYWAWKNIKKLYPDLKYIGLCHYRRFFAIRNYKKINIKNKIIVPQFWYQPYCVSDAYKIAHISEDWDILIKVILELYPEYINDINKIFYRGNKSLVYNMFICSFDILDDYCSWLFNILFELEKRIDITHYNSVQKRIFGYMSERLLYLYIYHNKIHTKCFQVVNIENENINVLHRLINIIRFRIAFFFARRRCS